MKKYLLLLTLLLTSCVDMSRQKVVIVTPTLVVTTSEQGTLSKICFTDTQPKLGDLYVCPSEKQSQDMNWKFIEKLKEEKVNEH